MPQTPPLPPPPPTPAANEGDAPPNAAPSLSCIDRLCAGAVRHDVRAIAQTWDDGREKHHASLLATAKSPPLGLLLFDAATLSVFLAG